MPSSTSLITFRVRTPLSTRSVELYGSWDNFQKPYSMVRDTRMGPEHWYGCHNFSNIICDGNLSVTSTSRDGGLKMGGTYWYYYTLDNEIEFHDSAQLSTTACPLLPGQLVNVLQMPVALSGNRSRNPSTSSSSSDLHTLNPNDKYINPRPVPARPMLYRLNTSPTTTEPDLTIGSSASATPWSAISNRDIAAGRFFRFPRKASVDADHTSSNPANGGLQAAFRVRSSRSQSPGGRDDGAGVQSRAGKLLLRSRSMQRSSHKYVADDRSEESPPSRGLLFRNASEERVPRLNSFSQHRRERSTSRDPSSLRNTATLEDLTPIAVNPSVVEQRWGLDPLKEVATPGVPSAGLNMQEIMDEKQAVDVHKRLPTLPNTPSSAYPASISDIVSREVEINLNNLESHFSATTIDSEATSRVQSMYEPEQGRWSLWEPPNGILSATTTVFEDLSPDPRMSIRMPMPMSILMPGPVSSATTHFDNLSPDPLLEMPRFQSIRVTNDDDESYLPSERSYSNPAARSSTGATTPSTCIMETDYEADCEDESQDVTRRYRSSSDSIAPSRQHYSLPLDEFSSMVTLKQPMLSRHGSSHEDDVEAVSSMGDAFRPQPTELSKDALVHSENMQRLLDELSYLSELIQH